MVLLASRRIVRIIGAIMHEAAMNPPPVVVPSIGARQVPGLLPPLEAQLPYEYLPRVTRPLHPAPETVLPVLCAHTHDRNIRVNNTIIIIIIITFFLEVS